MATLRQKKALSNLVENGGVFKDAMIDAGYALTTATQPIKLKESKIYKELIKDNFDVSYVVDQLYKLADLTKIESFKVAKDISEDQIKELKEAIELSGNIFYGLQMSQGSLYCYYAMPDAMAKAKAIDTIIKLKGDYAPEKIVLQPAQIVGTRIINLSKQNEEIEIEEGNPPRAEKMT